MATTTRKKTEEVEAEDVRVDEQEYLNELVKIKLPRKAGSVNQTQFVGVNGKTWLIQRGKTVEVPRYVALIIEQSMEQEEKNAEMFDKLAGESRF